MANPTCTLAQLTASSIAPCLKRFGRTERLSLMVYFNAIELAAIGGTNYTAGLGHAGSLMAATECINQDLSISNPTQIPSLPFLVIAYNNAVNAGGAPASTPATLADAISCNNDFTMAHKWAQITLLTCSLGSHKAYPQ